MKAAKESTSPMEIMQDLLNSETLNAAENLLYFKEHACNNLTVSKTTEDKNVLDKAPQSIDQEKSHLTCRQKILLTMMQLKLDLSFVSLAILFQISSKSVKRYFNRTIQHLSSLLKPVIRFPSKEEIAANIPVNTCRVKTYSNYKSRHTVKFLIGVTPSDLISYLSKGYGGKTSDKAIFNNENLIEKLEIGDSIMVDKGFHIEKECFENFIKLIRPPFLKKEKQFSKADAEKTASIARARVHVERAIQRIKIFKVTKGTIPWSLSPYLQDIMTVIVALSNL
ncbi:hypothetical protein ILUMI_00283 [Ignelater luminosus]|uniref:DDE Tnp4 domain-containing protein n=1 Tax=Ignelater luminosus TaxID=2038154 RepID=A0A8K0GQD8_IGNLU|nr:hypothetical protein ILUMI_00283 [Ignelater luminosus]